MNRVRFLAMIYIACHFFELFLPEEMYALAPKSHIKGGEWLRSLREKLGYTQVEFGTLVLGLRNVLRKIQQWEKGVAIPPDIVKQLEDLERRGTIEVDFSPERSYFAIEKEILYQIGLKAIREYSLDGDRGKLYRIFGVETEEKLHRVLMDMQLKRYGGNWSHLYEGIVVKLPDRPITLRQGEIEGRVVVFRKALEKSGGNVKGAAKSLGITPGHFSEQGLLRALKAVENLMEAERSTQEEPEGEMKPSDAPQPEMGTVKPPKRLSDYKSWKDIPPGLEVIFPRKKDMDDLGRGKILKIITEGINLPPYYAVEVQFEAYFGPITLSGKSLENLIVVAPRERRGRMAVPPGDAALRKGKEINGAL